ncbi:UDP-N-acetyl-D-mannosaminuronic acid transferase [Vibrio stylophorae]|uniref:UDP-N-acetyl-D-mannosaminuronic acid transferase n=1 Tax=Vibrio stylophorae TaxID=659351 RepID=A0ABM8ZVB4_9VIBR|nr:WecB/TagA/CpsF family glycosyltransferase [Vibrio stylophorae]CAH0534280.1 UDP-N-acetyl-D-mannosaminuronic acid transferase [Vibrio stylophorae]
MTDKVKLADIEVSCFSSMEEVIDEIMEQHLEDASIAVAINPEKILKSLDCEMTRKAIDLANIRYLDGYGALKLASFKIRKKLSRIPGCELWEALMMASVDRKIPVFVLGAKTETLTKTVNKLIESGVNVAGSHDGYFDDEDSLIEQIKISQAKILTVALGSPKQELFMAKCKARGVTSFMMGVGGTYDVYTGRVRRAPKIWCRANLEWLYRLLQQPTRFMRQLRLLNFIRLAVLKKI